MKPILGRDGQTQEEMLQWFERRWRCHRSRLRHMGLTKLNALELDILAGEVTHQEMHYHEKSK